MFFSKKRRKSKDLKTKFDLKKDFFGFTKKRKTFII